MNKRLMTFYSGLGGIVGLVECHIGCFDVIFALNGVVATISPGEASHVVRRQGAETHAISPFYIIKSGRTDIADVCTAVTQLLSACW